MHDFSEQGLWWLPETPERKIGGMMTFDVESGVRLQLVGSLSERVGFDTNHLDHHPIILGFAPNKRVTLIECDESSSTVSSPSGVVTETHRATYAIVGGHLDESMSFDRVKIELSHLADFTTFTGIEEATQFEDRRATKIEIKVDLRTPPVIAEIEGGSVELDLSWKLPAPKPHETHITEVPFFRVRLTTPARIETLLKDYVTPLRNLVSLAVDRPVDLRSVQVSGPGMTFDPEGRPLMADLLMRPILAPKISSGSRDRVEPMFRFSDLDEVDFQHLVRRWLEIASSLEDTMNLFFGVRYFGDLPLEVRFLETVRATEIYHRVGHPRTAMPAKDFDALVNRILDRVESGDRTWLKDKLHWANEPSLAARLKDLFTLVGDALGPLGQESKRFQRSVVDSRNYYTHYAPALQSKALRGADLFRAVLVLQLLLRACFLHEVGFSLDRSTALIHELHDFRTAQFVGTAGS